FTDGRGLARSVYADNHNHGRRLIHVSERAVVGLERLEKEFADEAAQFGRIADEFTVHAFADSLQNLFGRGDADVGADERELEFLEQIGINLFLPRNDVFDARNKPVARLLNTALEFFE